MAIVAIIVSVISASYYLKIIKVLHSVSEDNISQQDQNINSTETINNVNSESMLTNYHSFLISTLTLSILLFVIKPSILLNSTQLLALTLFNY